MQNESSFYKYIKNPISIKCIYKYKGYQFWLVVGGVEYKYRYPIYARLPNQSISTDNLDIVLYLTNLPIRLSKGFNDYDGAKMYDCMGVVQKSYVRLVKREGTIVDYITGDIGREINISKLEDKELELLLTTTLKDIVEQKKKYIDSIVLKEKFKNKLTDKETRLQKVSNVINNMKLDLESMF